MIFNDNDARSIIVQTIGKILLKAYGENYQSVLTMFVDTPYPSPEALVELSEEQHKQLEDRFTMCINEAALQDTFEELISFLKETAEKLRKTHVQIKDTGRAWLDSFLCDDKDSFLHFSIYLRFATMFRVDVENFYRKFTNTRKHGRKMNDKNGKPILHSLFQYSPISSKESIPSIFTIDDYGERFEEAANLFKEILYVLGGTYTYVMSVNDMAREAKKFPSYCKKRLMRLVEEVQQTIAFDSGTPLISEALLQEFRKQLPKDIVKKIYSLDTNTLSSTLYHEVATKYKVPFGFLVASSINQQQGMSEIESTKVFVHIDNPAEKLQKATQAKVILKHISEFSAISLNGKKKMDKGIIACLFYKWTGTVMSASSFLKIYYNAECKDVKFHVAQSTFSNSISKIPAHSPLYELFSQKVMEVIDKYQGESIPSISISQKKKVDSNFITQTYA